MHPSRGGVSVVLVLLAAVSGLFSASGFGSASGSAASLACAEAGQTLSLSASGDDAGVTAQASALAAIDSFNEWARQYIAASPDAREGMVAEGVALARKRLPALMTIYQRSSRVARAYVVPANVRRQLPATVLALLESSPDGPSETAALALAASQKKDGGDDQLVFPMSSAVRISPADAAPVREGDGVKTIYALFIAGTEEAWWVEPRNMFLLLRDGYHVPEENMIVLTWGSGEPPDTTEIVDGEATVENLDAAFNTIAAAMDADDIFLWQIESHGSGYIGRIDNHPRNVAYHGYLGVEPKVAGDDDEHDFQESDFELSVFCGYGLQDGIDHHFGMGQWGVDWYAGFQMLLRKKVLSHFDSIYVEGLGYVSDSDVRLERFTDYALGDTNQNGVIDEGEVADFDGDGIPPYDRETGAFDEDDWGPIDVFEDDCNDWHSSIPGYAYTLFDDGLDDRADIDVNPGEVLQVDGTDADNDGCIDSIDLDGDGLFDSWIAINETMLIASGFSLTDDELNTYLDRLTNGTKIVITSTCYGGGFINDLSGPNTIILSGSPEEASASTGFVHLCFRKALTTYASLSDTDGDGRVSFMEATNVARLHPFTDADDYMAMFQYDDNGDFVGHEGPLPNGDDGALGAITNFGMPSPIIVEQPESQSVTAGNSLNLSVSVVAYPAPTYTWFKDGQLVDGATEATLKIGTAQCSDAGIYSVLAANDAGSILSETATITIAKGSQEISFADILDWTYGCGRIEMFATSTAGLSIQYTVSGPALESDGWLTITGAGTVIVTASQPGNDCFYAASDVVRSFVVQKAPLVIAVVSEQRNYGKDNPVFAVDYLGFVNGEGLDALTRGPDVTTIASRTSGVGDYAIVASNAQAENYAISYIDGTLTILPAAVEIQISDTEQHWDGSPKTPTISTTPEGVAVDITYSGSADAPTLPGEYEVVATASDPNYAGTATTLFHILDQIDFSGLYFGTLADGSPWGLSIGADNSGVFRAWSSSSQAAFEVSVTVASGGIITGSGTRRYAEASSVIEDEVTMTGTISLGQIEGILGTESFSGEVDSTVTGTYAGSYSTSFTYGNQGTLFFIVSSSGQAVVVVVTADWVDGGSGTVDSSGNLVASLDLGTEVAATIAAGTLSVSGTLSSTPSGGTVQISGVSESVDAENRIINLSTRGYVGSGDSVMIVGFVISGSGTQPLLIRAVGPTLGNAPFNVGGVISDPVITLRRQSDRLWLDDNDNWGTRDDADLVAAAITQTGAFQIPTDSLDSALVIDLPAGAYTATVAGVSSAEGVVLAEVYVIDDDTDSTARLVNISTRGFVGSGDAVMIPGFITQGNAPRRLLVRGVGPTLGEAPYNVTGVLEDPVLNVYLQGQAGAIASVDDWDVDGAGEELVEITASVSAFSLPRGSLDATMVVTIPPNTGYTVVVTGKSGATGVVIAEIYELP